MVESEPSVALDSNQSLTGDFKQKSKEGEERGENIVQDDVWSSLASLASSVATHSADKAKFAKDGLLGFVEKASLEADEIYRENIKGQLQELAKNISSIPQSMGTAIDKFLEPTMEKEQETIPIEYFSPVPDEKFMTSVQQHEKWSEFLDSVNAASSFGDVQERIILANDQRLCDLHNTLVPDTIANTDFWQGWRFWNYLNSIGANGKPKDNQPQNDKMEVEDEWEEWE